MHIKGQENFLTKKKGQENSWEPRGKFYWHLNCLAAAIKTKEEYQIYIGQSLNIDIWSSFLSVFFSVYILNKKKKKKVLWNFVTPTKKVWNCCSDNRQMMVNWLQGSPISCWDHVKTFIGKVINIHDECVKRKEKRKTQVKGVLLYHFALSCGVSWVNFLKNSSMVLL